MSLRLFHVGVMALVAVGAIGAASASACLVSQDGSPYLIDAGDLGHCSGNVARVIPASTCKDVPCCGTLAFALCLEGHYSDCSCTLLPGYEVVNAAGAALDAESIDLGGDCSVSEGGAEGGAGEGGATEGGAGEGGEAGGKDAEPAREGGKG